MKLKKLALSCLMLAVLLIACITLLPTEADADGLPFIFELNEDGNSYTLVDTYPFLSGEWAIPATYRGKPVTAIGCAFHYQGAEVTSVIIPDGVTHIGSGAFSGLKDLTSIIIPDTVTYIGDGAFPSSSNLQYTVYSNGKYLGNKSNPYQILMGVVDKQVKQFQIHKSTKFVYDSVFSGCNNLTSITIPNGVLGIGSYAFSDCGRITGITLPDSLTYIGSSAFSGCSSLTNITIPAGVTSISYSAFEDCSKLTSVVIMGDVTSIGSYAFSDCGSLTTISLPNSLISIGDDAFQRCKSLESIVIPNSVTHIGNNAFWFCDNLHGITIPDSVTNIGEYAFYCCYSLKVAELGSGITIVPEYAFAYCSSLTQILLHKNTDSIEKNAFTSTGISSVYFKGTQAEWDWMLIKDGNSSLEGAERILNYTGNTIHSFSSWKTTKSATCAAAGIKERTCSKCGTVEMQSIPVKLHTYKADTCTVCKYKFQPMIAVYNRSATVTSTGGANIWSQPYTSGTSKKIRTAGYNTKLTVIGKAVNASGSLWYKLSDGNWVYSTNILVTDYNLADVEYINKTFVVTSWGANIWSKPYSSGDSEVIKSVEKTAALRVVGQVRNSTGGLWYQLSTGGWIYSKNVNERIFDPAGVVAYKRSATVIVPGVINIWGQPSTKAPSTLTRTAAYQTKLNVVAKYTTAAGGVWYQLTDGNWVYSSNIRITDYNPADVQKVNKTVTVTSWGANVWSKPYSSGDSKVVKTVAKAANLKIDGQVRNSTYGLWYRLADGSGWIYSQNVAIR